MTKKQTFNYSFDLNKPQPAQSVEQMLNAAISLHQRGNLQQAEQIYRQIISRHPKFAYAMNMLGVLLSQKKEHIEGGKFLKKAVGLEPDVVDYHINLGFNLQEQGKLEKAEKEFATATRLDPGSADAWFNLGNVRLILKKPADAEKAFLKIIEEDRNYLPAYNNLGNIYRETRRYEDAIGMFSKVLQLKTDLPQTWYNLGLTYKNLGDGKNAVQCFEKVLAYDPANRRAGCQAGYCHGLLLNDLDGSIREFDKVIETNPDYISAYLQKSWILQSFGRYEEAVKFYYKALELDKTSADAYAGLVSCKQYTDADIKNLLKLADDESLEPRKLASLNFSLGSIFDAGKEYDTAFRHFQRGNRLYRDTYQYDVKSVENSVTSLINLFDKSYIEQKSGFGVNTELPVFVLGMPRSGTTLVEQIIASHPQVFGAGELKYLGDIVQTSMSLEEQLSTKLNPPVPDIADSMITSLANKYLSYTGNIKSDEVRVTDKMPQNFLYIGYIAVLFPKAKIIHCRRNPMDICLSIYTMNFTDHHPYAYDLVEIANYYRQYQRVMNHWESVLSDRIFTIQYEDIVDNLESLSRSLISYIGLDWDDRCLRFNETTRNIQTSSHLQVRQKIYTSSRERWRHYEPWLGPLRSALGET
jgi:tetratricopeptide (TPR) repeat protein